MTRKWRPGHTMGRGALLQGATEQSNVEIARNDRDDQRAARVRDQLKVITTATRCYAMLPN